MDKTQALHEFWNSFDIPAYDQNTIPADAKLPYITYEAATDSIDCPLALTASIWYRTTSWADIEQKSEQIAKHLYEMNPISVAIDGGRMYIAKGTPFAQRMSDADDMIRRIILNVTVEYFTAY